MLLAAAAKGVLSFVEASFAALTADSWPLTKMAAGFGLSLVFCASWGSSSVFVFIAEGGEDSRGDMFCDRGEADALIALAAEAARGASDWTLA
jgi:hypothetical protein